MPGTREAGGRMIGDCSCLRAPVVTSALAGVMDASEAAAAEQQSE